MDRRREERRRGAVALAAALIALSPGCLEVRPGAADDRDDACASCHGDPNREGTALRRSAPPRDLLGASDPSYPGVGAHTIHLDGSETHGPVACAECHIVPERTDDPGHADDERPADVVFGPLARQGSGSPAYDPLTRICSDSYCHGGARAVWTAPRSPEDACGSCHGLPPPPPHPPSDRCSEWHGAVVDAERRIVAPALHVDGQVQLGEGGCTGCHGSGTDPAPPPDTAGNTARTAIGVGAHQVHLSGGTASRAVRCDACHIVPETVTAPMHVDGLPAQVVFGGVGVAGARAPTWDRASATCADTWCHSPGPGGNASAPWTSLGPTGCTSCHGAPPAPPHPQMDDCARCHGAVVGPDHVTIIDRDRHVDGVVDVAFDDSCVACHGATDPAPPPDVSGATATTAPGVGAHRTHLDPPGRSRPVPCAECHVVPSTVLEAGHVDTPRPAEVIFSGVALAHDAAPSYANGSCQSTPCHGAVFPRGRASGGTNTAPDWTTVDGTQAACGTCHGLPPPRPHPLGDLNPVCSACHENIAPDNVTFTRPELHVDGVVTFTVP
jgi:predicted CxxxxCH...CXXCH cytochrome family protein